MAQPARTAGGTVANTVTEPNRTLFRSSRPSCQDARSPITTPSQQPEHTHQTPNAEMRLPTLPFNVYSPNVANGFVWLGTLSRRLLTRQQRRQRQTLSQQRRVLAANAARRTRTKKVRENAR